MLQCYPKPNNQDFHSTNYLCYCCLSEISLLYFRIFVWEKKREVIRFFFGLLILNTNKNRPSLKFSWIFLKLRLNEFETIEHRSPDQNLLQYRFYDLTTHYECTHRSDSRVININNFLEWRKSILECAMSIESTPSVKQREGQMWILFFIDCQILFNTSE
jgi:hypothetical protein